jgi:hypothetical protein
MLLNLARIATFAFPRRELGLITASLIASAAIARSQDEGWWYWRAIDDQTRRKPTLIGIGGHDKPSG